MNEAFEDLQEGVKGVLVQSIRFADDQAIVPHSQCGLQRIGLTDALQQTSEKYNMRIKCEKDSCEYHGRRGRRLSILVNDKELEQVIPRKYGDR